jgi:CheY-like chemotaxis protein
MPLEGLKILVVEDEFLVGLDIAGQLGKRGARIMKIVSNAREALAVLATPAPVELVVLDFLLDGHTAESLATTLVHRGIPFVLVTGRAEAALPAWLRDQPRCDKPVNEGELVETILMRWRAPNGTQSGAAPFSSSRQGSGSGEGA